MEKTQSRFIHVARFRQVQYISGFNESIAQDFLLCWIYFSIISARVTQQRFLSPEQELHAKAKF